MNPRKFRNAALVAAMTALGLTAGGSVSAADITANGPADAKLTQSSTVAKSPADYADRRFAMKAAQGGMAEVEMGNLAQTNAQSDQVKSFGARMAKDHAAAGDKLKEVASANNIALPSKMDRASEKELKKLQKLKGAQFDREYMNHMVADHKKDLKEFEKEAKSDRQNDVKRFAEETLPTLREHFALAQTTQAGAKSGMQGTTASGSSAKLNAAKTAGN